MTIVIKTQPDTLTLTLYSWKPTTITPMMKWALPIGLEGCKHKVLQEREKGKERVTLFLVDEPTMHDHSHSRYVECQGQFKLQVDAYNHQ